MGFKLYAPGTRKGNRFYVARVWAKGREREVSTNTRNESVARSLARDAEADIRTSSVVGQASTFTDAAASYLSTHDLSKQDIARVTKLMEHFGAMPAANVVNAEINAAARALYPGKQPQSWNRNVVAPAAAILHFAAENRTDVPYIKVKRFKEPEPANPKLRPDQIGVILNAAADPELYALLMIWAYHGFRIGETLNLDWDTHIDLTAREFKLWISKVKRWKTIPMEDAVFEALAALPKRTGHVFRWATRGAVYKHLRKLGVGFHFTPHMFRRSFASDLNDAGETTANIQEAGSWMSPRSVERYISVDPARVKTTLRKLPRGDTTGEPPQAAVNE